jgi:hypothetical protein
VHANCLQEISPASTDNSVTREIFEVKPARAAKESFQAEQRLDSSYRTLGSVSKINVGLALGLGVSS